MAVLFSPSGLQNKLPPHTQQNPRSAFDEDRYQVSVADEVSLKSDVDTLVMAAWWPLVRRHCAQWQAIT
jgi:hypothetical protein